MLFLSCVFRFDPVLAASVTVPRSWFAVFRLSKGSAPPRVGLLTSFPYGCACRLRRTCRIFMSCFVCFGLIPSSSPVSLFW